MFENRIYRYASFMQLGGLIAIYAYWIFQVQTGFLPTVSDEFAYYLNAQSFTENTTLRAAMTFTGKGSLLFQSDAHGFAYPLLHGTIGKIIGFHPLNLPFTNIVFIFLALLIISCQRDLQISQKTTLAVLLLAYILVPVYAFTYMQEALHFFVAVVFTLLLYKIYERESLRLVSLYLLLLVIAALFRPLWLFWSIGLLPLARNKKQFFQFSLIFLFYAGLSLVFVKLFIENFPSSFRVVTQLVGQGRIGEALQSLSAQFVLNVGAYFTGGFSQPYSYYLAKLLIFFSVVALLGLYHVRKIKIYLAAALIGVINFGLLLITYNAWDWREIRSMSPLFFMFAIIIVAKREKYLTLACLILCLSAFPSVYNLTTNFISEHKKQAVAFTSSAPFFKPPQSMLTLLDSKPQPLILFGYRPQDYSLDLLFLPLRTSSGKPVRYAINAYNDNLEDQSYDFVLYRSNSVPDWISSFAVLKTNYFALYQPVGVGRPWPQDERPTGDLKK